MSYRYSVYVLSPDRRFVEGGDSLEDAKSKAREIALTWRKDSRGQKVDMAEVWDNDIQAPVYGAKRKWGGGLEERSRLDGLVEQLEEQRSDTDNEGWAEGQGS